MPRRNYGHYYGNQTSLQMGCPGLSKGNKVHLDNYCVGVMAGQIDLASQKQFSVSFRLIKYLSRSGVLGAIGLCVDMTRLIDRIASFST